MNGAAKDGENKEAENLSPRGEAHGTGRKKERSEDEYKRLVHRLSRVEGQIRGIRGMVERSAYCPDILVQSAAVIAAMRAFSRELLANHIKSCVAEDIRQGDENAPEELAALLTKLMK